MSKPTPPFSRPGWTPLTVERRAERYRKARRRRAEVAGLALAVVLAFAPFLAALFVVHFASKWW